MLLRQLIIFIVCGGASLCVNAQDSLTFKQVVNSAIAQNANVQRAQIDVQLIQEKGRAEKSIIYPHLSANVSLDYFPLLPTSLVPGEFVGQPGTFIPVQFGQPWQALGGVTVQQLIYNEAYRRAIPARKMSVALNESLVQKSKEEVAFQVAQLYLQIKQTESAQITVTANEQRLTSLEKAVTASVVNGFAVKTDLVRVQLAQQQLIAQKQNLANALTYQREIIGFLSGMTIDSTRVFATVQLKPELQKQIKPSVDQLVIKQAMDLQALQIHAVKAEKYPDVRAYATGLGQTQRSNANLFGKNGRWFGMGAIGLRVQLPITDGGRLSSRLRQISHERNKQQLSLTQLQQLQAIEARNAETAWALEIQQLDLTQKTVTLAKEVYEGMRRQYQEGTQPLKELLDAQAALAEAETALEVKKVSVTVAELKWMKAAGYLGQLFSE